MEERVQRLIDTIRAGIIGDDRSIDGPFGPRRVTYADYTASGRVARLHRGLHPRRGAAALRQHPHRDLGHRAGRPRAFARTRARIIRERRWAAATTTSVIFCGSGATGAINKLIDDPEPAHARRPRRALRPARRTIPADERPVVFIGPYEHHSNELPVARVDRRRRGHRRGRRRAASTCAQLERRARGATRDRPLKIGSFSAASNVTGIASDTRAHRRAAAPPRRARRSGTSPPRRPTSTSR